MKMISLKDTFKGLSWRVVKRKKFNWPIFLIAVFSLSAVIFLSGCELIDRVLFGVSEPSGNSASEIIEVANPVNELQDELMLTDVQHKLLCRADERHGLMTPQQPAKARC